MKKKILTSVIVGCVSLTGYAFASTGNYSEAYIAYNQEGQSGTPASMNGTVTVSGQNNTGSSNDVWVELYKDVVGVDTLVNGLKIPPSTTLKTLYTENVATGSYYIHLDPAGTLYNSVIGYGKAQN